MSEDSFTVRDRRHSAAAESGTSDATSEAPADATGSSSAGAPMPPVDFSTFLLSLGTSALVHLGDAPTPEGPVQRNLPLAQQVIDILALLGDKTRGNLEPDESKLLEELLYDLRLRYVNATR